MTKIPGHKIFYAVHRGDGYMQGVPGLRFGDRTTKNEVSSEPFGVTACWKDSQRLDRVQTLVGRNFVSSSALSKDELRD